MADYWKSIPRKFCEFCKCWLTDNKPSIEFHERGRKHQDNVRKKIFDLRRKGQKAFQEERNTERMMKRIEQAALKAFQKDVVNNPDMSAQSGNYPVPATVQLPPTQDRSEIPVQKPKKQTNSKQNKKNKSNKIKTWFQAKTDDDQIYYWNSETGESSWEKPEEGYISILEQEKPQNEDPHTFKLIVDPTTLSNLESANVTNDSNPPVETSENQDSSPLEQTSLKSSSDSEVTRPETTPEPPPVMYNRNPYGQWTTVVTKPVKPINLQLPKKEIKPEYTVVVPVEEPQFKFKEKVVPSLTTKSKSIEIGFKKRKVNAQFKRNIRQKVEDEEES